ncbi:hypothetical protein P3T16_003043 [Paraburkholderia sp. GAS42]
MLVTDTTWAESHPVRRCLVEPYQAWRCVGWTSEMLNFWVVAARGQQAGKHLPDGWLVGGPEALLEIAPKLAPLAFSVYVLDSAADGRPAGLCQVTGIWRERGPAGRPAWFWYRTREGEFRPCSRFQFTAGSEAELECALTFDGPGDAG